MVRTRRLLPRLLIIVLLLSLPGAWFWCGRLAPPNHPPSFLKGLDITVAADSGPYEPGQYGRCRATDSAAAATALACGRKTDDGNIAWLPGDPREGRLETIAEHVRAAYGHAIGVVTTVQFSHATPAAFVSHNTDRNHYARIGEEIINVVQPEVVIGSGHPGSSGNYTFLGPTRWSKANYNRLRDGSSGYTFVERAAGKDGGTALAAAAAAATRLFGLFGGLGDFEPPVPTDDGSGSFTFSVKAAENPSLAAAATAALTVLSKNAHGFFLMVEGGDIDHANHSNNYRVLLGAMHQFAEAVQAGEAFIENGGDAINWTNTLFIVTSDHGNSFMRFKATPVRGFLPRVDAHGCPNDGTITYGGRRDYSATGFSSHTNEPVSLYAKGAGAALFEEYMGVQPKSWYGDAGSRIVDNTQVYEVMKRAAAEAGAKHIVLWIGDGMPKASEIAYARYRHGSCSGLPWASWPVSGYCTTWSVNTYNSFVKERNMKKFKESTFLTDPAAFARAGYDPALGGLKPYPDDRPALRDPDSLTQLRYLLGAQPPWALSINANDPKQKVSFLVSNDNPALFSKPPALKPDGSLTFTPAPAALGSATVTVAAKDNGSTVLGGSDTSAPQTFTITVAPAEPATGQ